MLPAPDGTVAVAPAASEARGAVDARGGRVGREAGVRAPQPIGAGRLGLDGRPARAVG